MIGQLVTSKAGHDKGRLYVILAEEKDFLYLADGRFRPQEKPKRKRSKHVQSINAFVDETLLKRLAAGEKIQPEELRSAIQRVMPGKNE